VCVTHHIGSEQQSHGLLPQRALPRRAGDAADTATSVLDRAVALLHPQLKDSTFLMKSSRPCADLKGSGGPVPLSSRLQTSPRSQRHLNTTQASSKSFVQVQRIPQHITHRNQPRIQACRELGRAPQLPRAISTASAHVKLIPSIVIITLITSHQLRWGKTRTSEPCSPRQRPSRLPRQLLPLPSQHLNARWRMERMMHRWAEISTVLGQIKCRCGTVLSPGDFALAQKHALVVLADTVHLSELDLG